MSPTPTPVRRSSGGGGSYISPTPTPTVTPEVLGAATQLPATGVGVADVMKLAISALMLMSGIALVATDKRSLRSVRAR